MDKKSYNNSCDITNSKVAEWQAFQNEEDFEIDFSEELVNNSKQVKYLEKSKSEFSDSIVNERQQRLIQQVAELELELEL